MMCYRVSSPHSQNLFVISRKSLNIFLKGECLRSLVKWPMHQGAHNLWITQKATAKGTSLILSFNYTFWPILGSEFCVSVGGMQFNPEAWTKRVHNVILKASSLHRGPKFEAWSHEDMVTMGSWQPSGGIKVDYLLLRFSPDMESNDSGDNPLGSTYTNLYTYNNYMAPQHSNYVQGWSICTRLQKSDCQENKCKFSFPEGRVYVITQEKTIWWVFFWVPRWPPWDTVHLTLLLAHFK